MPALFIYLIKVNVALLIFCAGYYAVLRHLTFYNLNRIYLVTAIIFSTLYPLLDLSAFLNRHEEIARPVQVVILNWQEPVKNITQTFMGHDMWFWLLAAFWSGVVLFGIRLAMQLLSLYRLHKRSEPVQLHQYMIRVIEGDINPFSFWRNIYVNPKNHKAQDLDAILEHEQIHVNEWHTLDILLGEVSAIFYWFNPGVWLMKRAIRENIEFITDQKVLMKGVDCKAYQYSLLSVNLAAESNALVNHFNISTIKKRIIMMNAKRSSKVNVTRYLFLVPVVMVLLLLFSVSKAEIKKVAKSGAHMMKAFTIAVKDIAHIDGPAPAPATRKAKPLAHSVSHTSAISSAVFNAVADHPLDLKFFHFLSITHDSAAKEGFNITKLLAQGLADTSKKVFKIRINGDEKPDIYINGVKTDVALENISQDDIVKVQVTKDDKDGAGKSSVYITTKGHEDKIVQGMLIKADTINVSVRAKADRSKINGYVARTTSNGTMTFTTATPVTTLRVNGKAMPAGTISNIKTVIHGDTIYTQTLNLSRDVKHDSLPKEIVVRGYASRASSPTQMLNIVTGRDRNEPISFTDKLVIINGKESTEKELKKISVDKIDSVSVMKGSDAANKYGDKGKNGVVVITTKK